MHHKSISKMTNDPPRQERRLPQELIDAIIDHLHDDIRSLGSCSLVCKSWTGSAHFHLFSELSFCGPGVKRRLESAPAVTPFIRHLRLDTQKWGETLPLFVGLTNLRSLIVSDLPVYRLPVHALTALFHHFSAAVDVRLHDVGFTDPDQLIQFVCAFPCLQRLAIECSHISFDTPKFHSPTQTSTSSPSPHLRVLELDDMYMDAMLEWFLSLPHCPALCAVCLHPTIKNSSETIARLLSALESSLEYFFISADVADLGTLISSSARSTLYAIPGLHRQINIRRNTHLRSLHIRLAGNSDDAPLVTQMPSQTSGTQMEEVTFEIGPEFIGDIYKVGWDEIDAALQDSTRIKTVNVRVIQWNKRYECAASWVVDHMPRCHARGILHVFLGPNWQYSYSFPR